MTEWSDPLRVPPQYKRRPEGGVTPEYVQFNLYTLCQIGGLYDFVALAVEQDHLVMLTAWRLDSQAPSVIDYMKNRDRIRSTPNTQETRHAPSQ